jgi:hypothetical protein
VVVLAATWLYVRASGRTLRELSGESTPGLHAVQLRELSDEPSMAAASLSEA